MKTRFPVKKLTTAAMLLALGMVLPTLMHGIGVGSVMLPMHIPVLLGGLLLGMPWGAAIGFILPYLSSFTGMPPLFPTAVTMSFELCAYGAFTGLFYRKLHWNIYPSLLLSMLIGRGISGLVNAVLLGATGSVYTLEAFLTGAFVTGLPGIIVQIALIPVLVLLLEKSRLFAKPARKVHAA
ncbi:MAG: ECF transporter S component [Clostridia bacterium]|nr:ECF transporter S component [Clostridia bacterium]